MGADAAAADPAPPAPAVPSPEAAPATTAPRLLLVFFASLLVPATFPVAGVGLTPYRALLLFAVVPLTLRVLRDPGNRITAADGLFAGYIAWISLAIYANHGAARLPFIVSSAVDLFGGYVVGRALIRNAADYRLLFRYFVWALIALAPFAVIELLTRRNIPLEIVALFAQAPSPAGESQRLGLFRVQTVFDHYILFGLFCSIGFANVYYIHLGRLRAGLPRLALVGGMAFMALSSAPVISLGIQALLTLWDRTMRFLPGRWPVLILVIVVGVSVIELAYPGGLLALVIENLSFDPSTGWGRTEIFQYGSAEVVRHPVFGIGLNEWVRPFWRKGSIDNFWLVTAMRYGLPALGLLWLAIGANVVAILRRRDLDDAAAAMRRGYLLAWVGLGFTLATVHMWGAVGVFVMAYIGAGGWFYVQDRVSADAAARRARRTAAAGRDRPQGAALPLTRRAAASLAEGEADRPAPAPPRRTPVRRSLSPARRAGVRR